MGILGVVVFIIIILYFIFYFILFFYYKLAHLKFFAFGHIYASLNLFHVWFNILFLRVPTRTHARTHASFNPRII